MYAICILIERLIKSAFHMHTIIIQYCQRETERENGSEREVERPEDIIITELNGVKLN